ncbi:MAG: hypothetical protein AMXMBFR33_49260 [Candidatus Xenobia bacterium]
MLEFGWDGGTGQADQPAPEVGHGPLHSAREGHALAHAALRAATRRRMGDVKLGGQEKVAVAGAIFQPGAMKRHQVTFGCWQFCGAGR